MKLRMYLMMVFVALLTFGAVQAQEQPSREKIESMRVGMITNRLSLSSDQAQQFWPLYNEYRKTKKGYKEEIKNLEHKAGTASDEDLMKDINRYHELKMLDAKTDAEFKDKFLKVISPRQLFELYKTERQFMMMMLKRLQK